MRGDFFVVCSNIIIINEFFFCFFQPENRFCKIRKRVYGNPKILEEKKGKIKTRIEVISDHHSVSIQKKREKGKKDVLVQSHFIDVPHIKQEHTWDCGLACILMVLRTLHINHYDIKDLQAFCNTNSIWTADLAYLLHKFSISFSYITVTLGANPNFSLETFYKKQLGDDIVRVNVLFKRSREAGINIECRSIKGDEIALLIMSGKYIVIALVDQFILSQSWTEDLYISDFYIGTSGGYTGHYIVICGYDALTDEFEIRDPASSRSQGTISSRCLEKARKSFGTDEDILLIHLENADT